MNVKQQLLLRSNLSDTELQQQKFSKFKESKQGLSSISLILFFYICLEAEVLEKRIREVIDKLSLIL